MNTTLAAPTVAVEPTSIVGETARATDADVELLRTVPQRYRQLADELGKRIIGQEQIIRDL